jgi:SNF2 family DNA or RNA helicase
MPDLHLSLVHNPTAVTVRRGLDVHGDFWLRVWSEWGSTGSGDTNREVTVSIERFLKNLTWFTPACRSWNVHPVLDDGVTQVLRERGRVGAQLRAALAGAPLDEHAVRQRLEGSRYIRDLRPFQVRDVGRLLALPNGANFSVPGAGKTAVAYAVYEAEHRAGRVDKMLVVAPLSAFSAWLEEAEASFDEVPIVRRFDGGPILGAEVVLVNYHRLDSGYVQLADWVGSSPTMVLLDEAHRMKRGWSGQWGTHCLSLALRAARRDVLTGTPAPQAPSDLEALMDYLWPGQAQSILPADALKANPGPDVGHQVAAAIQPLFSRTTKPELDLPPMTFHPVIVPLEGLQHEIYSALRDQLLIGFGTTQVERSDLSHMGRVVMYLLEAATNPALLPVGDNEADIFRHPPLEIPEGSTLFELIGNYPVHETPPKFIELAKLIRDNAELGRKTLIWTNFIRNIKFLQRQLAAYEPAAIHGAVPSSPDVTPGAVTRESELLRFRSDPNCRVLIANPAAMSEGVSLHDSCHDAVYLDRTFNAGQYLQSLDRIHRLGLPANQDTRITFLLTAGTVDEVVDSRIRIKAERLSQMLRDPAITLMALPDDEDYGPAIDTGEDVEALFAHLRGENVPD